jgi:arabinan endo-1,5-alpha-L-arabinosidase
MNARFLVALLLTAAVSPAFGLEGQINCHDPATVTECNGKYFSFGTSGNLMSDDGWTWNGNARGPGGGVAPDICKVGDRYLVTAGGVNARWTKSLDPASPDFGYSTAFNLVRSDGTELNAIDSSLMVDPNDGKLYMTCGSYVGYTRIYELDPKTGQFLDGKYTTIAVSCEATDMIFQDGWYYLFGNKASCCNGASSGYNIRMGRSKKPTGPFIENTGLDMLTSAGKLFAASTGRWIGPGHFGRLIEDEGVQKWSMHYEADLDRGGASVLDIRPLYFKNGWPVAGFNILKETTYKITGNSGAALQVGGTAAGNGEFVITPVPNVGGYPGMPFCKITVGGSNAVLAINANKELVTVPAFTSAPEQLWRLDQLTDGTWRIVPRTISKNKEAMALTTGGGATTLAKYDYKNAGQHWNFVVPGDPKLVKEGTYEIESARSGRALELAVEHVAVGGGRGGRGGGGMRGGGAPGGAPAGGAPGVRGPIFSDGLIPVAAPGGAPAGGPDAAGGAPGRGAARGMGGGMGGGGGGMFGGSGRGPIADQDAAQVSGNWPTDNIDARLANYMCQAQQKWTIQPVANSGGLYKIVIAGTTRALAATADRDVVTVPTFSGGPEQLWRFDKLEDGAWRITPKSIPNVQEELSLTTIGTGGVTLTKYDPTSDKQHWNVIAP